LRRKYNLLDDKINWEVVYILFYVNDYLGCFHISIKSPLLTIYYYILVPFRFIGVWEHYRYEFIINLFHSQFFKKVYKNNKINIYTTLLHKVETKII